MATPPHDDDPRRGPRYFEPPFWPPSKGPPRRPFSGRREPYDRTVGLILAATGLLMIVGGLTVFALAPAWQDQFTNDQMLERTDGRDLCVLLLCVVPGTVFLVAGIYRGRK